MQCMCMLDALRGACRVGSDCLQYMYGSVHARHYPGPNMTMLPHGLDTFLKVSPLHPSIVV